MISTLLQTSLPLREAALKYRARGWSVIPVHLFFSSANTAKAEKKPLIKWSIYQQRLPTEEEIRSWWNHWPQAQIGVVTGRISGIVVIDVDVGAQERDLSRLSIPPTVLSHTPSGGWHYFLAYPNQYIPSRAGLLHIDSHLDVRADGGFAVIPPSQYPDARAYQWRIDPASYKIAALPTALLPLLLDTGATQSVTGLLAGVPHGARNNTAAKVVGHLLHRLSPTVWEQIGWPALQEWNQRNTPPLPEKELRTVFDSITHREHAKSLINRSQLPFVQQRKHQELLDLVTQVKAEFFHDQFDEPHVHFVVHDHWEIHKIRSKIFKCWLTGTYWETHHKIATPDLLDTVLTILEYRALYTGKKYPLHNRVAWHEGAIWYDLSDEKWNAVRIDQTGWDVVKRPPILLRRYKHQAPHISSHISSHQGRENFGLFLRLFNPSDESDASDDISGSLLLQVYLISCLVPNIAHPIPIFYGEQGSAKTTRFKMIKRLLDPSVMDILSLPPSREDLVQKLSHHWIAFFDNAGTISQDISNILCRAVTGDGISKRVLYTDDEDFIYSFRRCVGLNGINCAANQPDLLDRSLLFRFQRIPDDQRKTEQELWESFEKLKPTVLAGIFDTLVKAQRIYPTVKLCKIPRMADFNQWGCAIAQALGYDQEQFLQAYQENTQSQQEEILGENPLANAIQALLLEQPSWQGSASELLERLEHFAPTLKINTRNPEWPKSANSLSRKLNVLSHNLAIHGIQIHRLKDTLGIRGRVFSLSQKAPKGEVLEEARNIVAGVALVAEELNIAKVTDFLGGTVSDDTCDETGSGQSFLPNTVANQPEKNNWMDKIFTWAAAQNFPQFPLKDNERQQPYLFINSGEAAWRTYLAKCSLDELKELWERSQRTA